MGLKSEATLLKKLEKHVKKKKAYPVKKCKEAKMKREDYRAMKDFTESRECAYCHKRGEELKICGACQSVWYCCREHQKLHWKQEHKSLCSRATQQREDKLPK